MIDSQTTITGQDQQRIFSGNIFIFYAYDIAEDINLSKIEAAHVLQTRAFTPSKYFKNYHIPLSVDLPTGENSPYCISSRIHNFGVLSLVYKIPFNDTLEGVRRNMNVWDLQYREQSTSDAQAIFNKVKSFVKQPRFFYLRTSYVVIQVNQEPSGNIARELKEQYGTVVTSLLRFEMETLSEYQRNAILEDASGYYRGDLIIIDTEAAFVYDDDYAAILDLFEFANIQQVELQWYDRILDQQLNVVYLREVWTLPITAYIPFIGTWARDPISDLDRLKVEISAIIERMESSIKIAGDVYASETYTVLAQKLDLKNWKESIDTKLAIIKDIHLVYQNKTDSIKEDLLSVLIAMLIFIELIVGILSYLK